MFITAAVRLYHSSCDKTFDYAAFSEFGFYNVLIQIFKLLTNQDIEYVYMEHNLNFSDQD